MSTTATTSPAHVLDDLMGQRHSCRAYLPDRVPRETVEEMLVAAGRTPSWCNTQPWHVHVVSGAARVRLSEKLLAAVVADPGEHSDIPFPPSYAGVHAERRRQAGWQLYEAVGVEKGDRAASAREMLKNFSFFGAPHVAVVTTAASLGTYGAVDCGLFLQSFLLAAQARGIAATPQAALASQSPVIRGELGLGDDRHVLVGISFGYADKEHPANSYRTDRQELGELASWIEE